MGLPPQELLTGGSILADSHSLRQSGINGMINRGMGDLAA